jgi:hypothetical protein
MMEVTKEQLRDRYGSSETEELDVNQKSTILVFLLLALSGAIS